jgi:ribosome-binding factor A
VTSRRLLKAAEAIREVVAASILTELRDPRVRDVTVVGVSVSPDMREAKVAVSIMGNETQQQTALRGLQNSAGFLQSKIARRIETRHTPRLQFVIDKGVQHALQVNSILAELARERGEQTTAPPEHADGADPNGPASDVSEPDDVSPDDPDSSRLDS